MNSYEDQVPNLQELGLCRIESIDKYDAIVFDCDGVLLDSNDLKIEAFKNVLRKANFEPLVVKKFSDIQISSFGTSRYQLFDRLLSGEFGVVPSTVTKEDLLDEFRSVIAEGYLTVSETEGMRALVTQWSTKLPLFVISGSDEIELQEVFRVRELKHLFLGIFGSPETKIENFVKVKRILYARGVVDPKILFVGDAEADVEAARHHNFDFLFISRYSKVREAMQQRGLNSDYFFYAETLAELLK